MSSRGLQPICSTLGVPVNSLSPVVEAVEKAPKQILGRDAEQMTSQNAPQSTILMPGKGQVLPGNIVLTGQRDLFYRFVRHTKH